jgi:hypothetical protein
MCKVIVLFKSSLFTTLALYSIAKHSILAYRCRYLLRLLTSDCAALLLDASSVMKSGTNNRSK